MRLLDIIEDSSSSKNQVHCVFEFCDKVLSHELNKRVAPLSMDRTRKLMKDLLTAVDILHAKMIMHRDIKPDNILIDR